MKGADALTAIAVGEAAGIQAKNALIAELTERVITLTGGGTLSEAQTAGAEARISEISELEEEGKLSPDS